MKSPEPDTQERILSAAANIYSRRGSRGMTTRVVAQEAGVSELTLFRHFGTKQGLVAALTERFSRPEDLDRVFAGSDTGNLEADLSTIATNALAAMGEVQGLVRVQLMETAEHPEQEPFLAKRPEAAIARLSAFLANRQRVGQIRAGDPMLMAHVFLGTLFARSVGAPMFRRAVPNPDAEVVAAMVGIFVNGVAGRSEKT